VKKMASSSIRRILTGNKKYPLVLEIHERPMLSSTQGFWGLCVVLRQTMASQGWIVFSPNYRGSNNMGRTYQRAVINDAVMAPVAMYGGYCCRQSGERRRRKTDRVSGWSYGGS